jgi:hypothetical protein
MAICATRHNDSPYVCDPIRLLPKEYYVDSASAVIFIPVIICSVCYTLIYRLALSKMAKVHAVTPGPAGAQNTLLKQQLKVGQIKVDMIIGLIIKLRL